MRRSLLICYGFLSCFSLLLLVWLIPAYTPPYMGYGIASSVLPNLLAALILALSLVLFLKLWRDKADCAESPIRGEHALHLAKYAVILFGTFPLMEYIGFLPASILCLVALQWVAGQRKPLTIALIAVIVSSLAYYMAVYLLSVPMP